ncbi:MAG: hypothetical protein H6Q89_2906 [Myxococcaceae bacterium]|nr:hypothetical protein [Myxococcaceae bacterium]
MTEPIDQLEGLVLCRVGDHRIAFPASNVEQISEWALGDRPVPQARAAFSLPPANGRCVEDGLGGLVVDSLEIASDPLPLLPVPAMLLGAVGGALRGFVLLADQLCPVLSVTEFAQYLGRSKA